MRILLASLLFTAACGSSVSTTATSSTRAIVNGQVDVEHPEVGALCDDSGFPFCTGTYVGTRTVVTTAHCFDGGDPAFVYFGGDANADAAACVGGAADACARFSAVADAVASPTYNQNTLAGDVGVAQLVEDPIGIAPAALAFDETALTAADEGSDVVFVGFGVTNGVDQTGGGQRRIVTSTLQAVGPDNATGVSSEQVFCDIASGGPCAGDSGAPMFVDRGGTPAIAAVAGFGDAPCADFVIATRTDTVGTRAFLDEFLAAEGEGEGDEGEGEGEGDEGEGEGDEGEGDEGEGDGAHASEGEGEADGGCSATRGEPIAALVVALSLLRSRKRAVERRRAE